ncbi:hypothetical protein D3C84_840210 [compost metagenome]
MAQGDELQQLVLARWQGLIDALASQPLCRRQGGEIGARYGLEQGGELHRFLQEVDGPLLEGLHRQGHLPVAGEKQYGDGTLGRLQPLLQLGPRQARHAAIQDQAGGPGRVYVTQERLAVGEAADPQIAALQHEAQGVEHGPIVVDQVERGLGLARHLSSRC